MSVLGHRISRGDHIPSEMQVNLYPGHTQMVSNVIIGNPVTRVGLQWEVDREEWRLHLRESGSSRELSSGVVESLLKAFKESIIRSEYKGSVDFVRTINTRIREAGPLSVCVTQPIVYLGFSSRGSSKILVEFSDPKWSY